MKFKIFFIALFVNLTVFLFGPYQAMAKYEEPKYDIISKSGDIEIRRYSELVAATVSVSGSRKSSADEAFMVLAGYIFGKNTSKKSGQKEKIEMTTPVAMKEETSQMEMTFFMPSKYQVDSLPKPLDDRIVLSKVPGRTVASIRFSGIADNKSVKDQKEKLVRFLEKNSTKHSSEHFVAVYNPPWTLPFLRRNEIWIKTDLP